MNTKPLEFAHSEETINGRQIVELAIQHQPVPRLPVALVAGGEWYVTSAGRTFSQIIKHPQQIADVFIENFHKTGQDLIWTGAGLLNYPIHFLGCDIVDDSAISPMLSGTVITKLEELQDLDVATVLDNPVMQGIIKSHHLVADAIGRETFIMPTLWGPFTTASRILGLEKMMLETIKNPQGVKELTSFSRDLVWGLIQRITDHEDIPGFNISEPVASGSLISPAAFREFVMPYLKNLKQLAADMNKYISLHICGDTTRILEDILSLEPDCFSLEAEVDLSQAKSILQGKVCVLGNVSPTGVFLTGNPDDVKKEARDCISAWGKSSGYILAPGCDFPREVPFDNVMALMSFKKT